MAVAINLNGILNANHIINDNIRMDMVADAIRLNGYAINNEKIMDMDTRFRVLQTID